MNIQGASIKVKLSQMFSMVVLSQISVILRHLLMITLSRGLPVMNPMSLIDIENVLLLTI